MSSPLGVRRVRDPRDRPPRGCLQSRKLVSGRPVGSRHDHRRDRAKPALSHSRAKQCARPAPPDAFEMDEDHEPTSTGPSSLSLSGKSSAVRSTGYRQSPRKSQTPRRFKATVTTSSSSLLLPSSSSSLVGESRRSCFARATRMSILSAAPCIARQAGRSFPTRATRGRVRKPIDQRTPKQPITATESGLVFVAQAQR